MRTLAILWLPAILFAGTGVYVPATAQEAVTPPPAVRAAVTPDTILAWAATAVAMIESDQAGPLWDGASAAAKQHVTRADFIAALASARQPLGPTQRREWTVVRRQRGAAGGGVPAGEYASVETLAHFAGNRAKAELITFRHDEDGTWRFMGYVIR